MRAGVGLGIAALISLAAIVWLVKAQSLQPESVPRGAPVPDAGTEPRASTGESGAPARPSAAATGQPAARPGEGPKVVSGAKQLDADARSRIEGLTINVVSYSETPERRFVMLNQRIVRESESVADGIVVKRILPEGALLDVGGHEVMVRPD